MSDMIDRDAEIKALEATTSQWHFGALHKLMDINFIYKSASGSHSYDEGYEYAEGWLRGFQEVPPSKVEVSVEPKSPPPKVEP